jgi:tetratricopeptide (TPR) repeat protein
MNKFQNELLRGWKIHQQRKFAEAAAIYRQVLAAAPDDANAWCYLGIALHDQRHYSQAADTYRQALKLQPQFPIAWNNLGNTLRYLHQFDEADTCFQRAIQLKPDYLNAFKNRGTLHVWIGNLDRGEEYYRHALHIQPNDAELHRNLGVIYLLQGKFAPGWCEYRWRWRVGDLRRPSDHLPVWEGSDLTGKRILLSAEQGLGDTLHFVRFAQLLSDRGAQTLVYCQPQLLGLLQTNRRLGRVFPNNLAIPEEIDCQCSLIDVADVLGIDGQNIPAQIPYLQPASHLVNYWSSRFSRQTGRMRVGIAWQGNPEHQADAFRSVPLRCFERLKPLPGVELISLQAGYGSEQLADWKGPQAIATLDANVDQSSGAFMDTAAILSQLDLVITSDTAIAHLAGAMGIPTWIALGYVPDWRWLLEREDSPWYPTVRLFRQSQSGDWDGVFERISRELESSFSRGSRGSIE